MTRLATVLVLLCCLAGVALGYRELSTPVVVSPEATVEVAAGQSLWAVARQLEEEAVVRNAAVLVLLARVRALDTKIRHGVHSFEGALTVDDVLEELIRVPRPTVRVTIPEGTTWRGAADLFEQAGVCSAGNYEKAVCDPALLQQIGASDKANCAEGYLFPDTYDLSPSMDASAVVAMQVRRFESVVRPILVAAPAPPTLATAGGKDDADWRNRVLVLASIIEKETGQATERSVISGVFHNRLRRGMLLQTDPTVIYGIVAGGGPWDGNLRRTHLREPGPYNTYVNPGLPPGPICNPGIDAIRAALEPDANDFIFFVAKGDGSHQFSRNLGDHNRAVRRYQLGR